tara:strand:- start:1066 stop:2580 length:1515 start_codon:yes stop_codon:yes gene_type:complete
MPQDNPENLSAIIALAIFILPIIVAFLYRYKAKKLKGSLAKSQLEITTIKAERDSLIETLKPITDVKQEAGRLYSEADAANLNAKSVLKAAKEKAQELVDQGQSEADKTIESAKNRAQEIAGSALEAKEKADSYAAAIKAMKNTIEGYQDDYIIPNHTVLDDLADEYSHKEAGEQLKLARKRVKDMVKDSRAADCDYAEANRRAYAIHFAVDAFNGKVDTALAKVKHDNYGKIKQAIIDAYALVNHNGQPFRNARIEQEYLDARLEELKWAVATHELRQQELAEQKELREQIREEEKARREMEKAIKDAEKEERLLQKALEKARKELAGATEEQKLQYEAQLAELESKLSEAEAKGQRALSMAQQTKRGHVYVISNIGSFGEEVFKVGMTRRLEPMDRVKELGDASVPFSFDVHAMIYSDDAPALEKSLHRVFDDKSVNKVNPRKEFFKLPLSEIKQAVEQENVDDVHWTLKAEAAEYRESMSINRSIVKQKNEAENQKSAVMA